MGFYDYVTQFGTQCFYTAASISINKKVVLSPANYTGTPQIFAVCIGLASRAAQILLILLLVLYYTDKVAYEQKYANLRGTTRSWIGASALYAKQHELHSSSLVDHLCTDTKAYWYHSASCEDMMNTGNRLGAFSSSCEYNISCIYPEYPEATEKISEVELHVITYEKFMVYRGVACATGSISPCNADEEYWGLGPKCKCWKVSNRFLIGVEHMVFTVSHELEQLNKVFSGEISEQPETYIYRGELDNFSSGVQKSFREGENVHGTVQEWLTWAGGVNLDDDNQVARDDYPPPHPLPDINGSNHMPSYRMTGIEVILEVGYNQTLDATGKLVVACNLFVSRRGGYHSFGSKPGYIKYRDSAASDDVLVYDRYMRGINFKIRYAKGLRRDWWLDFTNWLDIFLYISMIPFIVERVFYGLGLVCGWLQEYVGCVHRKLEQLFTFVSYETTLWHQACNEEFTPDGVHSKRLLSSLIVYMLFSLYNNTENLGDEPSLSYKNALLLFKEFLSKDKQATHTFNPGTMGITYDDNGCVENVSPDGQAHTMFISKGDQIVEVDKQPYSKDAVVKAEQSGYAYEVTFLKAIETHYFKPGAMGIKYDDNGFVKEVSPDGPASDLRISEGDQIVRVNQKLYSKDAVITAETSESIYEIAFLKAKTIGIEGLAREVTSQVTGVQVEALVKWLFQVADDGKTKGGAQSISLNRLAQKLGGHPKHPTINECLTHAMAPAMAMQPEGLSRRGKKNSKISDVEA